MRTSCYSALTKLLSTKNICGVMLNMLQSRYIFGVVVISVANKHSAMIYSKVMGVVFDGIHIGHIKISEMGLIFFIDLHCNLYE